MKIGFTVGVWDLLHNGHVKLIRRCLKMCDVLYVGIMTDYWVKVQKGKNRPKQCLLLRMAKLAQAFDLEIPHKLKIVVLDTLDMSQYLQMVDIWFKGPGQYKMRPEKCPQGVWEVVLPRTKNISTTKLLKGKK